MSDPARMGAIVRRHGPRLAGNIAGVVASAVVAASLWIVALVIRDAPTGVLVAAAGLTGLAALLLVAVLRDAGRAVVAYEHGIGWGAHTVHFDDVAKVHVRDATIVLRLRAGGFVTVPLNVSERDTLIEHVGGARD